MSTAEPRGTLTGVKQIDTPVDLRSSFKCKLQAGQGRITAGYPTG